MTNNLPSMSFDAGVWKKRGKRGKFHLNGMSHKAILQCARGGLAIINRLSPETCQILLPSILKLIRELQGHEEGKPWKGKSATSEKEEGARGGRRGDI